jgi:hypothetical protein
VSHGRYAYEQYCAASDGKSLATGDTPAAWSDLGFAIRAAWEFSAERTVMRALTDLGHLWVLPDPNDLA